MESERLMERYCETRELELRNELLTQYAYIAGIAAKKFSGRGVEYDDLYQVASLALLKALERFECSRGVKFSSFAMPSVIGEIKNYFRDRSRTIRLPRRAGEQLRRFRLVQDELMKKLGRPPRPDEIAAAMDVTAEQVYELMEAGESMHMLSLDEPAPGGDSDGLRLADMLGEDQRDYGDIENRDFLKRALALLSDEERAVLTERFGMNRSQRAIAEDMGVSQMYISRLERRVLAKMRSMMAQ